MMTTTISVSEVSSSDIIANGTNGYQIYLQDNMFDHVIIVIQLNI